MRASDERRGQVRTAEPNKENHKAADQIIHPLVNAVAEPYYHSGKNRKRRRECEVFQDLHPRHRHNLRAFRRACG